MQKIVVQVQVHCDKCRTEALKIAASVHGVNKVSIQGVDRDKLEVIGDGVDSVCLTRDLRKKLGYASIVQVETVGKPAAEEKAPTPHLQIIRPIYCYHESSSSDGCSVM